MNKIRLRILNPELVTEPPRYMTEHSSGMDIRASLETDYILKSRGFALIPTGISVAVPEGYELQVRARSGLAARNGIGVLNGPGTIDSDYRGEIKVILFNFSDIDFTIHHGDRIAQLVLAKVEKANLEIVDELPETIRNEGGFGHSGII